LAEGSWRLALTECALIIRRAKYGLPAGHLQRREHRPNGWDDRMIELWNNTWSIASDTPQTLRNLVAAQVLDEMANYVQRKN
jgi:hypothetical protein